MADMVGSKKGGDLWKGSGTGTQTQSKFYNLVKDRRVFIDDFVEASIRHGRARNAAVAVPCFTPSAPQDYDRSLGVRRQFVRGQCTRCLITLSGEAT